MSKPRDATECECSSDAACGNHHRDMLLVCAEPNKSTAPCKIPSMSKRSVRCPVCGGLPRYHSHDLFLECRDCGSLMQMSELVEKATDQTRLRYARQRDLKDGTVDRFPWDNPAAYLPHARLGNRRTRMGFDLRGQCSSRTEDQTQCSRKELPGKIYCWQHRRVNA